MSGEGDGVTKLESLEMAFDLKSIVDGNNDSIAQSEPGEVQDDPINRNNAFTVTILDAEVETRTVLYEASL